MLIDINYALYAINASQTRLWQMGVSSERLNRVDIHAESLQIEHALRQLNSLINDKDEYL